MVSSSRTTTPDPSTADIILFQDIFVVSSVNPDGAKFDNVTRIEAKGENYATMAILDYPTNLLSLTLNERFTLVTARTLDLSGQEPDPEKDSWRDIGDDLSDGYELVMYGRVYKYDDSRTGAIGSKVDVLISFGGLLMCLNGDHTALHRFRKGDQVYLLIRK